ncbi:MAG: excinuclease ABC subunit UvrC [Bacteroidia bacterium]|nr:excinuclease ABC subunit UvrC [Bacteroidia bacterium]
MIEDFSEKIRLFLRSLPEEPGVYQYYDDEGRILYVGKAKNLKKRVTSYFTKDHYESSRIRLLVKKISDIKTIIVKNEMDALLLENNLIKELLPRYNVLLKDDKTYPWICIKKENFPRIFPTRNVIKDGSEYFGPYASIKSMYAMLDIIRQLFPIRTCNLALTQKNIEAKKFRSCLELHIGRCKAPCIALQAEMEYNENIKKARNIIKGNFSSVLKDLKNEMFELSEKMEFEKAQLLKEKIVLLEKYEGKSMVVSPVVEDAEVFTIISDEKSAYINFLKIVNGAIIQGISTEIKKKLEETDRDILLMCILEIRRKIKSETKEVIVSFDPELEFPGVSFTVPKAGDKKHLLDLSMKNAEQFKKEKEKQAELVDPERHSKRILQTMMKDLRMKEEPQHIECFDNSNIQGEFAVSAMTVFKNAKPSKKDYRHFNVKTVVGPDDFATMEEVILRRYKRVLEEDLEMPQLIVIDGGKGQVSAAMNSLEKLGLRGKVTVIGIAKRLEEIYYPGDSTPMYLDKRSETLRILQQIRDEAHRFGITHHRKKRSKGTIKSELNEIKGISEKSAETLLKEFSSVKNIKEKTEEEIAAVIGKSKAKLISEYFHKPIQE